MNETTARNLTAWSAGMGLLFIILALFSGINGNPLSIVSLLLGLVAIGATMFFGLRYQKERAVRWQQELRNNQQNLDRLFSEAQEDEPEKQNRDDVD